jgi:hypothetical protein
VLAEQIEPDKKKLKTMIHAQEKLSEESNNDEGAECDEENNDPDMCQHVKEKEKFDHYAMDAATEEQSKEQASNRKEEEESQDDTKSMDVDMHEDEELEILEDENVLKQDPEKLPNENKSSDKRDQKEKGTVIQILTFDLNMILTHKIINFIYREGHFLFKYIYI